MIVYTRGLTLFLIRRLPAGERHENVQPLVLLSLRSEYFNLDAQSEHAGNVREAYGYHVRGWHSFERWLYRQLVGYGVIR